MDDDIDKVDIALRTSIRCRRAVFHRTVCYRRGGGEPAAAPNAIVVFSPM